MSVSIGSISDLFQFSTWAGGVASFSRCLRFENHMFFETIDIVTGCRFIGSMSAASILESMYPSVAPSVSLLVRLSRRLPHNTFISPFVRPSFRPSVRPFVHPSVCLSVRPSVCPSVHASVTCVWRRICKVYASPACPSVSMCQCVAPSLDQPVRLSRSMYVL